MRLRRIAALWKKIDLSDFQTLSWLDGLLIAGLLGMALSWRLCRYTWKGIWLDESFSLITALMDDPLKTICYRNINGQNPALFEFILHFVVNKFGYDIDIARLPSVIFSTLTVYFIYRALRDFEGRVAGVVAGLLYAYQNYSITYAHEIRCYALLGLFTSVAVWGFLRWIAAPEDRRFQITTLAGSLGAAYTHNFGLWVIISQTLFVAILSSVREKLRKSYLIHMGLFLLAYAPQGILTTWVFLSGIESPWAAHPGWTDWSYQISRFLNSAEWVYGNEGYFKDWLALSLMTLTALALFRSYFLSDSFERLAYVTFSGLGVMFMFFLFSQFRSSWLDRYLMPVSIGFLIMVVSVIFSYPLLWRTAFLAVLGWIFSQAAYPYSYPNLSVSRVVDKAKQINPHRRYPLFVWPFYILAPILYHYDKQLFLKSAKYTLDPLANALIVGEEAFIWAPDYINFRRPCWYKDVDTAVVILPNSRDSTFLKALEADSFVVEPSIREDPYSPATVLIAYRKKKPQDGS